jgi:2-aminoethylphosphonate-pyruvate transaminase
MNLDAAGINRAILVTGRHGPLVRQLLDDHMESGLDLEVVEFDHCEDCDASALLAARDAIGSEPFMMANPTAVFSPLLASELMAWPCDPKTGCMAVETDLNKVFDPEPLLKVELDGHRASRVGRDLTQYQAVSVGLCRLNGSYFEAIESASDTQKLSVEEGLTELARQGLLEAQPTDGLMWHDVTDGQSLKHARRLIRVHGADLSPEASGCHIARTGDPKRVLSYIEGILHEKKALHYTLMNPGPVLTTARVKSALVHHDICHRDEEFPKVMRRLRRKLRRVFGGGPNHEVLLITGSGTSGMEAAISSCVPHDKKLLVVANGAFGERFVEIAELHRLQMVNLKYGWGELVNPEDVETLLSDDPDIFAVAMCHHETSVGIMNPIHQVGNICRAHDRLFIVDAVASLGGEELDVRRDNIDVCVSSANKCLHAISGVAVVCVNQRAWERIESVPPRVYYLDLKRYRRYAVQSEETPFTPAVSNYFALDAAVDELLAASVEDRVETYRKRNRKIRDAFEAMGITFLTETGCEFKTISCARVPSYITYKEMYDEMKRRGYLIYNSKEHLKDRYFQVANMGDLSDETLDAFLSSLRMVLKQAVRREKKTAAGRSHGSQAHPKARGGN